jgi:hypothetical protein
MSGIAIADVAMIPSNSHRHREESEPLALAKLYQSTGRQAERTPCSRLRSKASRRRLSCRRSPRRRR